MNRTGEGIWENNVPNLLPNDSVVYLKQ